MDTGDKAVVVWEGKFFVIIRYPSKCIIFDEYGIHGICGTMYWAGVPSEARYDAHGTAVAGMVERPVEYEDCVRPLNRQHMDDVVANSHLRPDADQMRTKIANDELPNQRHQAIISSMTSMVLILAWVIHPDAWVAIGAIAVVIAYIQHRVTKETEARLQKALDGVDKQIEWLEYKRDSAYDLLAAIDNLARIRGNDDIPL